MGRSMTNAELDRDNGKLADLPRAELGERWKELYPRDPPRGISTRLMVRAIAYEMQVRRHGGLSRALRQSLDDFARSSKAAASNGSPILTPGTRLVREWQGRVHVVDVMNEAFRWNGGAYSSLSRIAREITGTRWSGPRFFGLRSKRERAA